MAETPAGNQTATTLAAARVPLAWVMVLGYLAQLLISLVKAGGVVLTRRTDTSPADLLVAASAHPTGATLAAVLVLLCAVWRPVGPRVRPLALTLAVPASLAAAAVALLSILAAFDSGVPGNSLLIGGFTLVGDALPVGVVAALAWAIARGRHEVAATVPPGPRPATVAPAPDAEARPTPEAKSPREPSWRPDHASGMVWTSAAGAAERQRAAAYGDPGTSRGGWGTEPPALEPKPDERPDEGA